MSPSDTLSQNIHRAAEAIAQADAILIGAGAGMGVDSGLPDFRGNEGFWKAYPPFRGRQFSEMSNPKWFASDPNQAWGFFGHRYHLYRDSEPHAGFQILRRWCDAKPRGAMIFTSNVDGQFQKAGFSENVIVECHGSIHYLQCSQCQTIWPADDLQIEIEMSTICATSALPECSTCGQVARPNILMFGDWSWMDHRTDQQMSRFSQWLRSLEDDRLVVIELGAGLAIPTVRVHCELAGGTLVRINPRDSDGSDETIALPLGALDALTRIDAVVTTIS